MRRGGSGISSVFFAITGPALALTHDAFAVRLGRPSTMTDQQLRDRADATTALILGGLSARP